MVMVAPSLLAADFADLGEQVKKVETCGADMLHLDIMDGHFVPNLTFGAPLIKSIRHHTCLPFDAHLMVNEPEKMLDWFAQIPVDFITIHAEAVSDLNSIIDKIHALGIKAGVALKPQTSADVLSQVLDKLDLILVMTVEPGFGGQKFMEDMLPKIKQIRTMIANRDIILSVDGGINLQTGQMACDAGADMLVAGTYVFGSNNWRDSINSLKQGV